MFPKRFLLVLRRHLGRSTAGSYSPSGPGGGDPADIADCGLSYPCRTDADCTAPYESCAQYSPGAYQDASIRELIYDRASRPGDLRNKLPHASTMVGNFCVPPTHVALVDNDVAIGGPGGIAVKAAARLSPSGAFMDVVTLLID